MLIIAQYWKIGTLRVNRSHWLLPRARRTWRWSVKCVISKRSRNKQSVRAAGVQASSLSVDEPHSSECTKVNRIRTRWSASCYYPLAAQRTIGERKSWAMLPVASTQKFGAQDGCRIVPLCKCINISCSCIQKKAVSNILVPITKIISGSRGESRLYCEEIVSTEKISSSIHPFHLFVLNLHAQPPK